MSKSAVASQRWRWLEFCQWSTFAQRSSTSALIDSRQFVVFSDRPSTSYTPSRRWNRTLKEQAIHGRIFQNLEAVRAAVADFVERYNQTWRLEKLGYHTPIEAREEYELRQAA